jgi:uroporphyrin-III C-methyltransferase
MKVTSKLGPKLQMREKITSGKVFLVGAGPGDPGLLTLKAYTILKKCDIVIYDALLNEDIVKFVPDHTEKVFIGKSRHHSRLTQAEVEQMMVDKAKEGKTVVRLKGGDPFMFGRGGEEAEILTKSGILWEVVPGVTSGIAAPAYAGIPTTHRDCASSVTFITGHDASNKPKVEWKEIRKNFNTLVIYMGITHIRENVQNLLKSNYEPDTPIAIIESGTTPKQRIRTGTLGTINDMVDENPVETPALIVIGDVVRYREKLTPFLSISTLDMSEFEP